MQPEQVYKLAQIVEDLGKATGARVTIEKLEDCDQIAFVWLKARIKKIEEGAVA